MKKNEKNAEKEDPSDKRNSDADETRNGSNERIPRNSDEKKISAQDMDKRARKSYHNDGPGGSYSGF